MAPTEEYPVGQLNPDAYPIFAACAGCGMAFLILLSSWGTHDRIPHLKPPPKPADWRMIWGTYVDMWRAVRLLPSFALLIGVVLFAVAQFRIAQAMTVPMNTYFWEFTSLQIGMFVGVYVFSAILALVLAARVFRPV